MSVVKIMKPFANLTKKHPNAPNVALVLQSK